MSIIHKLEKISVKILENLMDIPDTAVLGMSAYANLAKEFKAAGLMFLSYDMNFIQVNTSVANLKIIPSFSVHPDHISIGTITIETVNLLETLGKLDIPKNPFARMFAECLIS